MIPKSINTPTTIQAIIKVNFGLLYIQMPNLVIAQRAINTKNLITQCNTFLSPEEDPYNPARPYAIQKAIKPIPAKIRYSYNGLIGSPNGDVNSSNNNFN